MKRLLWVVLSAALVGGILYGTFWRGYSVLKRFKKPPTANSHASLAPNLSQRDLEAAQATQAARSLLTDPSFSRQMEAWPSNGFAGSPWERVSLAYEKALLIRYPEVLRREGRTLVVSYNGKVVDTLTPVPQVKGDMACDSYIAAKVMSLYDETTQTPHPLVEVTCHQGEFEHNLLILPSGHAWPVQSASASPDGRMVAANAWGSKAGPVLTLLDAASFRPLATFEIGCDILGWQTPARLKVSCAREASPQSFDAWVWRDDKGDWQMQSTRLTLIQDVSEQIDTDIPPSPPAFPGPPSPQSPDPRLHFTAKSYKSASSPS